MHRIPFASLLVCLSFCPLWSGQPERYVAIDNVCAWPNLTQLKDGSLTATIFNRPHHGKGEGDVECWASSDGGHFWELRGTVTSHKPGTVRMNVAVGRAHDGSLVVLNSGWGGANFRERILDPLVSRSSDGGKTWQESFSVTAPAGTQYIIPFGDVVQGPGKMLAASFYDWAIPQEDPPKSTSYLLFSRDDGRTWSEAVVIGADDYSETALVRLKSGPWLAAVRTGGDGHLDLFYSEDEGKTWALSGPVSLPRQHPGHLLELSDGRVLLTYGIRERHHYGVGYRVSEDRGRTWNAPEHLAHLEETKDGGYPATLQLDDGTLVTAYYSNGVVQHRRYHMGVIRWKMPLK